MIWDLVLKGTAVTAIAAVSALVRRKSPPGNQLGGAGARRCWSRPRASKERRSSGNVCKIGMLARQRSGGSSNLPRSSLVKCPAATGSFRAMIAGTAQPVHDHELLSHGRRP
jgi:hypothetical protein